VWKYLRYFLVSLRYRRAISIEEHGPRTCRALIQGKDISAHGSPAKWEVSGFESFDIIGDHILPGDTIRHTAISLLLNNGADPFAVQKPAGHSDVRLTTQVYSHVQADALRKAAGVLDRIGLDGEGGTGTAYRQAMAS
jgi:integrase